MSKAIIQESLLSKGYFPKELPPVFTTEDFGHHIEAILTEWRNKSIFKTDTKSLGKTPCKKKRKNAYTYKLKSAEAEIISMPKRGYERRNVHIIHPVPQALLVSELAENWKSIQKWLSRQTFSVDEIRVSDKYERSIKGINFPLHHAKNSFLEATSDWVVKTDITRFYPSIYTHSIAWAAYGKDRVKRQMGYYNGSLADRLDVLVRSCNRNQTIGIPIGPETSRIIAEVISARIDEGFTDKRRELLEGTVNRLQDDWVVGVNTLEEAEKILSLISTLYREFGLEINGSKTSIEHIVAAERVTWLSDIRAFLSHKPGPLKASRLREFLTICLRLQAENQVEPVISYALAVIENNEFGQSDIESLESFLLKSAIVAPNSMNRICRIILNLQFETKAVSVKRIGERFINLAERNLDKGHLFEVIWLLYTLRGLKRPFRTKRICEAAEFTPSSALALLLLDMKNKNISLGNLPKTEWENLISKDSIRSDWTWLLAYEGFRHGWLSDKKNLLAGPLFKPMADRQVVFYDPARNIVKSKVLAKKTRMIRKNQNIEIKLLFEVMRGINFSY